MEPDPDPGGPKTCGSGGSGSGFGSGSATLPERVDEVYEAGRLGKGDHLVIITRVSIRVSLEDEKSLSDWRRADWDGMRAEMRAGNWLQELRRNGAARAWDILRDKVEEVTRKYVQVRRKRNSNRPAWMTQEILRAVRRKKRIWRAFRGGQITEEYKEAEKKVRNLIRNSKRGFEKKLAAGGGRQQTTILCLHQAEDTEPVFYWAPEEPGRRDCV